MKMKKEMDVIIARGYQLIHKTDSGNRVLPVSDAALLPENDVAAAEKKKNDIDQDINITTAKKIKRITRMKDLIKWATATKYQKGPKYFGRKVLELRKKAVLRSVPDEEEEGDLNWSNDSPKISFRWDVESCSSNSTISMASSSSSSSQMGVHDLFISALQHSNHRKGNWITTDSEFVVLEL